jgi:cell division septation protein DedD
VRSHIILPPIPPRAIKAEVLAPETAGTPPDLAEIRRGTGASSQTDDEWEALIAEQPLNPSSRKPQKRSLLPLFGFLAVALVLIGMSFIWFVNPYPPLKEWISGIFSSGTQKRSESAPKNAERHSTMKPAAVAVAIADSATESARIWNYYLQVASRKELSIAQRTANSFRRQGIATVVEGEYIRKQKATFYRVRLGPFASAARAEAVRDSLKGMAPADAFVDSVRKEYDIRSQASATIVQPEAKGGRPVVRHSAPMASEPAKGFGVKVASHRTAEAARRELQRLTAKGFPAFLTTSQLPSGNWYRIYVGPFSSRTEADRYGQLLRQAVGSEVYTIEFGR